VRWYSPPDWIESEASTEDSCSSDGSGSESLSTRGHLSRRMRKEGMLVDDGSTKSLIHF
jgi:Rab3 GTPase-activating protein catalytic subunit